MSYFQADPPLDFDDANAFLAAISGTVPSLEKQPDWNKELDLDQLYTPLAEQKFENSSPEVVSSNGSIDEMFAGGSYNSDFSNPLAQFYNSNVDTFVPSAEDENNSYTNSLGSEHSPYLDFSPNSGPSSLHSPIIKQEFDFDAGFPSTVPDLNYDAFGAPHQIQNGPNGTQNQFLRSPGTSGAQNLVKAEYNENQISSETNTSPETESPPAKKVEIRPKAKGSKVAKPERKQKTSHNVIEKKYRTSINSKILELREVVPTLKFATGKARVSMADLDGLSPACKLNKASILTKADEYIKHMKKKNKALKKSIKELQERVNKASSGQQVVDASSGPTQTFMDRATSLFESQSAPSSLFHRRVYQQPQSAEENPTSDLISNLNSNSNSNSNFGSNYASYADMNPRSMSYPPQPQSGLNSNMFFGGLATLMGSSYLNDNNFQAMSALPLFPVSLFGASAAAPSLLYTLRMAMVGLGLFMIINSCAGIFKSKSGNGKTRSTSDIARELLSITGAGTREPINDSDRARVTCLLMGKKNATLRSWVQMYLCLRTRQADFETLLLQFLVGTAIIKRGTPLSRLFALDLRFRKRALITTDYSGTCEALCSVKNLIRNVDGLSMFESDSFASRLSNLSHGRPICQDISSGENPLMFVDALLRNEDNLYGLVFEWRVLEIIHELTLVYLDVFASSSQASDEAIEEVKEDASKLSEVVKDSIFLSRQFSYFELLLNPGIVPKVLSNDKNYILNALQHITLSYREPDLTDDEDITDDDEADDRIDEVDNEAETPSECVTVAHSSICRKADPLDIIRKQKSMVGSMNLMNEEKYLVLLSSLISWYLENNEIEKSLELLNRLNLNEKKSSMSLLSFTCLLKLVSSILKAEGEEGEDSIASSKRKRSELTTNLSSSNCLALEKVVKSMRGWLNGEASPAFLSNELRGDLSDLIISKSIVLNKL